MESDGILELDADFLICNYKQASATNLSHMVDGKVSHDSVTRMLSGNEFKSMILLSKSLTVQRMN